MSQTIRAKLHSWIHDRKANVAIITALCALPLFGLTGLAIDYAIELAAKSRLDTATDAATVAAITTAKTVLSNGGTLASAQSQGHDQGVKAFFANAGLPSLLTAGVPQPSVAVTPTPGAGQSLTATASYSTTTKSQFGNLLNIQSNSISGKAAASTIYNPFYQFIFLVDVSGSMAIGATPADITGLINDPKIGCAVACHDPYNNRGPNYRLFASQDGWKLKIDYMNTAMQTFIQSVQAQSKIMSGQFSIGIDTFATTFQLAQAPSTDYNAVNSIASNIDVEDMMPLSISQGYTRTTVGLTSAMALINNIGDGRAFNQQKTFLIFLSDGVEDVEGNGSYGRGTDVSYTSACATIKTNNPNLTLISVDVAYPAIVDSQYNEFVAPFVAPSSPSMTSAMANCATPSWAFVATDGPAINSAMQKIWSQISQGLTRVTQ